MKLVTLVLVAVAACGSAPARPAAAPAAKPFSMKNYYLVLLKRGPAWTPEETAETKRLGEGHMANIKAMGAAKKLVLAGPTDVPETDRAAVAGIFILDAKDPAEVTTLLANDPAIAAGRFVPEVLPWYGPAGITFDGATP